MTKRINKMTNLALNPFKKGKKTEVEGVHRVIKKDSKLENSVEDYLRLKDLEFNGTLIDENHPCLVKTRRVLTPNKINEFLHYLINNDLVQGVQDTEYEREHLITGKYVSKLIQNSYCAGYNNFILNTQDIPINSMGMDIKGKKFNPIYLTINGSTGHDCGVGADYAYVLVYGNAGFSFGACSKRSYFKIYGNTNYSCANYVGNCSFEIHGDNKRDLGDHSNNSKFWISGSTSRLSSPDTYDSLFQTTNRKTYINFLRSVHEGDNTIQLLDKDGNVVKEEFYETE